MGRRGKNWKNRVQGQSFGRTKHDFILFLHLPFQFNVRVSWLAITGFKWLVKTKPEHLRRGTMGERAAKKFLKRAGMRFLTANFRSSRGEVDLVFRDGDCLVFVEVKTRSREDWTRPAAAVDAAKKLHLSQTALDYLKLLKNPRVAFRFDIVEVLLHQDRVAEVRHLSNAFPLSKPYRYA